MRMKLVAKFTWDVRYRISAAPWPRCWARVCGGRQTEEEEVVLHLFIAASYTAPLSNYLLRLFIGEFR